MLQHDCCRMRKKREAVGVYPDDLSQFQCARIVRPSIRPVAGEVDAICAALQGSRYRVWASVTFMMNASISARAASRSMPRD